MTKQDRTLSGLFSDGHDLQLIGNSSEYGGLRVVCTCGWKSRVIGVSDNFQRSNLRQAAERHIREVKT